MKNNETYIFSTRNIINEREKNIYSMEYFYEKIIFSVDVL